MPPTFRIGRITDPCADAPEPRSRNRVGFAGGFLRQNKFNPAPLDKHAETPQTARKKDRDHTLDQALEGTFPASDPVSVAQPYVKTQNEARAGRQERSAQLADA